MTLPSSKEELKDLINKINISLKSKAPPVEEEITILKTLFTKLKKPSFLLGLLSFYEKTKEISLLNFVKENSSHFTNDYSPKVNQLFVVYSALVNEECEPKRMNLEETFLVKYKKIFTDWFTFDYFKFSLFNPILNEGIGESFLGVNQRKKINKINGKNELENEFLECYYLISKEEYSLAMTKLNLFLKKLKFYPKNLAYYLHCYNLISFCLFYNGYFIESITYLEMANKLVTCDYFDRVIDFIKEGKGTMDVFIREFGTNFSKLKKKDLTDTFVDPFSLRNKKMIFNTQIYNHFILRDLIYESRDFLLTRIKERIKVKDLLPLFSDLFTKNVLSIHKRNKHLELTHYPSFNIQKIKNTFDLTKILEKSKRTFLLEIKNKKDKQKFYKERKSLDEKICEKIDLFDKIDFVSQVDYLLVGEIEFPFEKCKKLEKSKRIFRLSGFKLQYETKKVFYVLDPQNKLPKTKERLLPLLKEYDGVINRPAIQTDIKYTPISLLYFGHGNGQSYLNFKCETESVSLFGCSSAKRFFFFGANVHGSVYKYNCNVFIGCLWDVSDKDIDLISKEYLLKGVIDHKVARFNYLSGASVVIYELF